MNVHQSPPRQSENPADRGALVWPGVVPRIGLLARLYLVLSPVCPRRYAAFGAHCRHTLFRSRVCFLLTMGHYRPTSPGVPSRSQEVSFSPSDGRLPGVRLHTEGSGRAALSGMRATFQSHRSAFGILWSRCSSLRFLMSCHDHTLSQSDPPVPPLARGEAAHLTKHDPHWCVRSKITVYAVAMIAVASIARAKACGSARNDNCYCANSSVLL